MLIVSIVTTPECRKMDSNTSNNESLVSIQVQQGKKIILQPGVKIMQLPIQQTNKAHLSVQNGRQLIFKRIPISVEESFDLANKKKLKVDSSSQTLKNKDSEPVCIENTLEEIVSNELSETLKDKVEFTTAEFLNENLLKSKEDNEWDYSQNKDDNQDDSDDLYSEQYYTSQPIISGILCNEFNELSKNKTVSDGNIGTAVTQSLPQKQLQHKQLTSARFGGGKSSSSKKPADKFLEVPIPSNIEQYGDCLKTRLGRYHYGLTLNDPPFQFFQGVLKGASGQTLGVLFGDTHLISMLEAIPKEEIGHLVIDTTFRVIPKSTKGINRILTISLIFQYQVIPLWFAVVHCSSSELYKRIIIEFQQHILDWPIKSVLLNLEPPLCKAVQELFPKAELYGSWFYYCYSIWNEILTQNLADKCKSDAELMRVVKLLMVLPYLPPVGDTPSTISMVEGFEYIKTYYLEHDLPTEFISVLNYVAEFWFNQVKSENFSVFGKQTSAVNYVEIIQLALLAYLKPNGNIWTLNHSFQSVSRTAHVEFLRYLKGKRLVTKKNRSKKFNVPIRMNLKKLMMGTQDIATFLEKSTVYCDEMLDIFLHPLYPTTSNEASHYSHVEAWRIKVNTT